jgi:predicted nucleotidyltransferase component of viral defense system
MRYATAGAFRAALEARLKSEQSDGVGLSRLRKRIVFERLLARLKVVAPDGWLLKGGFALELRLGGRARTTKDIDIDWIVGEGEATELLLDAAALELDDMFSFDVQRAAVDHELAGGGQRWMVRAELAGRDFERVVIDVGFGMPPVVEPVVLEASRLLEFAEIPSIAVPALAVEQHLAEKLHAYSRTYSGDRPSSRVKDLVDIVVIAHTTTVDGERLRQAVTAIFERRATHEPPAALPSPPRDWARPWATLVKHLPAEPDLASGFSVAAAFWNPMLASPDGSVRWDPERLAW